MKRYGILAAIAVFSMGCVWAGSDKTYMKVNGESITQSQFQQYQKFLTEFNPQISKDPKAQAKETEDYLTDLLLIKQESKAYGHQLTDEMRERVLSSIAADSKLSVDQLKSELKAKGVDPYMLAEHRLMSQLMLEVMKDRFQDSFEVTNAKIEQKTKEMTHEQVRLNVAVLPSLLASKEEKAAMLAVLKSKKAKDPIRFSELGWSPIKNFPQDVVEELTKIKKSGYTDTISIDGGQSVRFQVLERRTFVPERNRVKETLLIEYLLKKQQDWLAKKKKSAKIRRY